MTKSELIEILARRQAHLKADDVDLAMKSLLEMMGGALASVAFTAFLTGITEPIEFMFMFLAPGLYAVHAVLTGIALSVSYSLGILHGFGFSAGFIDYVLNWGPKVSSKKVRLCRWSSAPGRNP